MKKDKYFIKKSKSFVATRHQNTYHFGVQNKLNWDVFRDGYIFIIQSYVALFRAKSALAEFLMVEQSATEGVMEIRTRNNGVKSIHTFAVVLRHLELRRAATLFKSPRAKTPCLLLLFDNSLTTPVLF